MLNLKKIGFIKMKDEDGLPIGNYKKDKIKVLNPRIKYNGKFQYLSLALEYEDVKQKDFTLYSFINKV